MTRRWSGSDRQRQSTLKHGGGIYFLIRGIEPLHWDMGSSFLHILQLAWLPVASFLAGALNTVAGGGSFLSLPALLNAMKGSGVGSVSAQATNNVALWPGQLTSAFAYRDDLNVHAKRLLPLSISSFVGGLAGAWLLLITPNKRFLYLLPWLLLFAAVMFVLSESLGRWLATRRD